MTPEKDDGKKIMVFGTFDVFHAGHEYFLREAKQLGDYLIAVIARDSTVQKVKGELPQHDERDRLHAVKESGYADKVTLGSEDDKYKVIRKYKPDIIALGYDQFVFTYALNKIIIDENLDTEIIRLEPYEPSMYKSSLIKTLAEDEEENEKAS
ncbi:adenylyltransferase/cytidyltransferase family protein [Patescibacteria group bacterium]